MHPEPRNTQLARTVAIISLLCPFLLAAIIAALKTNLLSFADDFTGFKGLGFFMGCGVVLLPTGTLAGIVAMTNDRSSWLARIGTALNVSLFIGFLLLIVSLAF